MTNLEDRPTIGERYARAAQSTDLTPALDHRTDADVLLSAGIVAAKDPKLALALAIYRLRLAGSTDGLHSIVESAQEWLLSYLSRGGNRPMPRPAREALLMSTLAWWANPTCPFCEGRCFVAVEDAGRLSAVECSACYGTGHRPLARSVPHPYIKHAYWIVDRLDANILTIQTAMGRLLSQRMDL